MTKNQLVIHTEESDLKDHKAMIAAMQQIPSIRPQLTWTKPQKKNWDHCRNTARQIARRLDYLQLIQAGILTKKVPDPIEADSKLLLLQKQHIVVWSDYLFAILGLLICNPNPSEKEDGFSIMEKKAQELKREFPFSSPRSVIFDICREAIEKGVSDSFLVEEENVVTLTTFRKDLQKEGKLLRGNFASNNEQEEEKRFISDCLSGGWESFLIGSIWHKRNRLPIRPYWQQFLKAHKSLVAFYKNNSTGNSQITIPYWRGGLLFDPKSNKPVLWK